MPPPFVPESVVNDIKALPDTDPICIFMKHLALQSAQMDINDLGALSLKLEPYLKAVASRSTSSKLKDSPTVVYLQEAAELALVEPSVDGQKLRPTERFAQDLQDIALPYVEAFPNPPITMEYWKVLMLRNIAHAAKGLPKADVESANIHNLALSHAVDSCAHCGTTEGLLSKCSGCSNATESSRATQYCNRECQTKDWMRHKAECKKMQEQIAVSRAGAIFRAVYYIMRRRCFRTIYTDVKEEHDILWGCINVTAGLTLKGKFPSFPFVNKWDVSLEDEEALLSCNNCDEFAKVMLPIAEALFQGSFH